MGRLMRLLPLAAALVALVSCRQRAEAVQTQSAIEGMVRRTMPAVERAVGLTFKRVPGVRIRSRQEVHDYALHKIDEDMPPAEFRAREAAYKHFGLIPDTLDLHGLLVSVLSEQIAGFYDPDSGALFIPSDVDTATLELKVISHEMVHALQDQYSSIDSVMHQKGDNDRLSAGQAVFEGQAVLGSILVIMPEQDVTRIPSMWDMRSAVGQQQDQMPVFASAPLWVRETLIFPYLAGGDFVRWFIINHPGEQPYGALMPVSTSQILHPERYAAREMPVAITIGPTPAGAAGYQDDLGEFETRLVLQQALGSEGQAEALSSGWMGDRYAVYGPHADALVWYVVWRDKPAAAAFVSGLRRGWAKRVEPGRRWRAETVSIDGRFGSVVVDAPKDWAGWKNLPPARVR